MCLLDTIDYHIQSHVPSMGYFLLSCWTVGIHRSLAKTIAIVLAYPQELDDGTPITEDTRYPITKYTMYLSHKTQRNQASTNMEVSSRLAIRLEGSIHSTREES